MARVSRPIRGKGAMRSGWRTEQIPAKVKGVVGHAGR